MCRSVYESNVNFFGSRFDLILILLSGFEKLINRIIFNLSIFLKNRNDHYGSGKVLKILSIGYQYIDPEDWKKKMALEYKYKVEVENKVEVEYKVDSEKVFEKMTHGAGSTIHVWQQTRGTFRKTEPQKK